MEAAFTDPFLGPLIVALQGRAIEVFREQSSENGHRVHVAHARLDGAPVGSDLVAGHLQFDLAPQLRLTVPEDAWPAVEKVIEQARSAR